MVDWWSTGPQGQATRAEFGPHVWELGWAARRVRPSQTVIGEKMGWKRV